MTDKAEPGIRAKLNIFEEIIQLYSQSFPQKLYGFLRMPFISRADKDSAFVLYF